MENFNYINDLLEDDSKVMLSMANEPESDDFYEIDDDFEELDLEGIDIEDEDYNDDDFEL